MVVPVLNRVLTGLLSGAAGGFLLGGIAGALELLVRAPGQNLDRTEMPVIVLGYSLFWLVAAGVHALARAVLSRQASGPRLFVEGAAVAFAGAGVLALVERVDVGWFGSPLAAGALLTDAALMIALVAIVGWIARRAQRVPRRVVGIGAGVAAALWLAALGLHGSGWFGPWTRLAGERGARAELPNVLVLVVDTLRADHLGCYGYERPTSPAIDRFAGESVLFTQNLAASTWTKPATASLLTGLHPPSHRQNTVESVLPEAVRRMPDAMSSAGYRTAYIVTNPWVARSFGFARDVDYYKETWQVPAFTSTALFHCLNEAERWTRSLGPARGSFAGFLRAIHDRLGFGDVGRQAGSANARLLRWVDHRPGRPFFAYVHYIEPHAPYAPVASQRRRFTDPDYRGARHSTPPRSPLGRPALPPAERELAVPDSQRRRFIDLYDAEIAELDAEFGRLMEALRDRDLYENTLVVLTSDHGEEFFEHGAWEHHHTPYQGLIHVPLLIKLSGGEKRGARIEGISRQVDVLPTILGLLGLRIWPEIQGIDLSPAIRSGGGEAPPLWALAETRLEEGPYARAYVEGDLKLIEVDAGDQIWQLFDLKADPREAQPLPIGHAAEIERLRVALSARIEDFSKLGTASEHRQLAPEEVDQLRALGYLGN